MKKGAHGNGEIETLRNQLPGIGVGRAREGMGEGYGSVEETLVEPG